MILFTLCDIPWWLALLLPFILGLLVGWAIWSRWKARVQELENEISRLKKKISTLEGELDTCRSKRADVEGDLALTKGRMREMESELNKWKSQSSGGGDIIQGAAGMVAGAVSGKAKENIAGINLYAKIPSDNLQVIEGIGPKMDEVLKENGINSWAVLATKSPEDINAILGKYGDKYRIIDPSTWPRQATLARDGKWEELINLQKSLSSGKESNTSETDSKVEKLMIKMGLLKKYKQDDLKAIEGIGPKIAGLLNDAGINTWKMLAGTSVTRIQDILNSAGSRYKLADPSSWPKQADLAAQGKWQELQEYQDFLQGGKEG